MRLHGLRKDVRVQQVHINPPLLAWCAGPNNMRCGPCSQGHVAVVEAPITYITFLNKFMQKSGPSIVATAIHAIIDQLYPVWAGDVLLFLVFGHRCSHTAFYLLQAHSFF